MEIEDAIQYPAECLHGSPPCGRCSVQPDKIWSQFDPERGSLREYPELQLKTKEILIRILKELSDISRKMSRSQR